MQQINVVRMFQAFLVTLFLLAIGMVCLCVNMLFKKNGKFPNTHIGASKAMKDRGINCATSQDREAQQSSKTQNK